MNRRGFSSRLLKLGVFSSVLSKLPSVAGAMGQQPLAAEEGGEGVHADSVRSSVGWPRTAKPVLRP